MHTDQEKTGVSPVDGCNFLKWNDGRIHLIKEIDQLRCTFAFFIEVASDPYSRIPCLNTSSNGTSALSTLFSYLPRLSHGN